MNVYDSSRLEGLLAAKGWALAAAKEEADFIFLNACSIREKAAQRVIARLKELKPLKKARPEIIVGVGGCLAEQEGVNFLAKVPFLSLVAGPRRLEEIPALLDTLDPHGPAVVLAGDSPKVATKPIYTPKKADLSSFVTIMEGCDNYCAYCVVPYLRGREKSRPEEEVIKEVTQLLAKGAQEIVLLGQNVNSYAPNSLDALNEPPFVSLLKKLDALPGLARLRFTTSHPKDFSLELINLFGTLKTLAPSLHLPLQSGSDKILKAMGRKYDLNRYLDLVANLRRVRPDIALYTDIIVGFPGETEEDLALTIKALDLIQFDAIFSFKYSDRPQTKALNLPDKVPEEVKTDRLIRLQERQKAISLVKNEAHIGSTVEVLVTGLGRHPGQLSGRTGGFKIVNFLGDSQLIGHFSAVTITGASATSLTGELLSPLNESDVLSD
jgi:tRNA-2-methylthio-N6-dimethylallyladenosine synthase